jgi:hypothetical protein
MLRDFDDEKIAQSHLIVLNRACFRPCALIQKEVVGLG